MSARRIGRRSDGSVIPGGTGLNTMAGCTALPRLAARRVPTSGLPPGRFSPAAIRWSSSSVNFSPAMRCAAASISTVTSSASCATATRAPGSKVEPIPAADRPVMKRRRFTASLCSSIVGCIPYEVILRNINRLILPSCSGPGGTDMPYQLRAARSLQACAVALLVPGIAAPAAHGQSSADFVPVTAAICPTTQPRKGWPPRTAISPSTKIASSTPAPTATSSPSTRRPAARSGKRKSWITTRIPRCRARGPSAPAAR